MNSRFKFRAWNTDSKEMISPSNQMNAGDVFRWEQDGQPLVIMQSTGLFDSRKQEIFEGDIVYIAGVGNAKVEFENGSVLFNKELYFDVIEDLEIVVGNIYENHGIDLVTPK